MNSDYDEFNATEALTPELQARIDLIREVKSEGSWREYKGVLWNCFALGMLAYLTPSLFTGRWGFVFSSLGTVVIMMSINDVRHVREQRRWELLMKMLRRDRFSE